MPGRVKLTTQALEEYIPRDALRKRAASVPAATSPAKKVKTALASSSEKKVKPVTTTVSQAKKSKPSREKVHACTHPGCDKSFVRPCRLEEHLRSHTGERPYKCTADLENCDKSFLRESHLKAHVKALHLKEKNLRCTFMMAPGSEDDRGEFGFKRKASEIESSLKEEDSTNEEEVLRECGARFRTNQQLKRHMESHMKTMPHICTEYPPCSAGFRKRGPLRRHIRSVHLNALPWACQLQDVDDPDKLCAAAFDTKGKLGGHIDTVHKRMMPALYTCAMCMILACGQEEAEQVLEKGDPKEGEEASAEIEGHGNDDCNDGLGSVQNLESGASTPFPIIRSVLVPDLADEMVPNPDVAILQGKMGFKTFRELRRHTIDMHPPTCKNCGYTCKNSRNLRIHIKNSHGAGVEERKIFPCETCGANFTKKHALKVHINLVHEHLRPFICTHAPCTKTYGYKAQLTRHVENYHSGRKPKPKPSRRKRKTAPGLIAQLTGIGYEESGRNIKCVVEECPYRFFRMYDLKSHLGSMKHGFTDGQVDELMVGAEGVTRGEHEMDDDSSETDENGSSGSESDEDEYSAEMEYVDLWDPMSDMEIVSDMEVDKDNE